MLLEFDEYFSIVGLSVRGTHRLITHGLLVPAYGGVVRKAFVPPVRFGLWLEGGVSVTVPSRRTVFVFVPIGRRERRDHHLPCCVVYATPATS